MFCVKKKSTKILKIFGQIILSHTETCTIQNKLVQLSLKTLQTSGFYRAPTNWSQRSIKRDAIATLKGSLQ